MRTRTGLTGLGAGRVCGYASGFAATLPGVEKVSTRHAKECVRHVKVSGSEA